MKLLFVYNANSGKLNLYKDIAHKILSPQTYPCSLCATTHGVFKERAAWKEFREHTDLEMNFFHTDEFRTAYRSKWLQNFDFPVILEENHGELSIFISKKELDEVEHVDALIQLIRKRSAASKK